jgi:hypothetical protein
LYLRKTVPGPDNGAVRSLPGNGISNVAALFAKIELKFVHTWCPERNDDGVIGHYYAIGVAGDRRLVDGVAISIGHSDFDKFR